MDILEDMGSIPGLPFVQLHGHVAQWTSLQSHIRWKTPGEIRQWLLLPWDPILIEFLPPLLLSPQGYVGENGPVSIISHTSAQKLSLNPATTS